MRLWTFLKRSFLKKDSNVSSSVQIYYDLRHKIEDFLSEAESKELGKIFKRFKGNITPDKNLTGDIKFPYLKEDKNPIVGKCSSCSLCSLNPPYSCLVCHKFNAFKEAKKALETGRKVVTSSISINDDEVTIQRLKKRIKELEIQVESFQELWIRYEINSLKLGINLGELGN